MDPETPETKDAFVPVHSRSRVTLDPAARDRDR